MARKIAVTAVVIFLINRGASVQVGCAAQTLWDWAPTEGAVPKWSVGRQRHAGRAAQALTPQQHMRWPGSSPEHEQAAPISPLATDRLCSRC